MIRQCTACNVNKPSQPKNPRSTQPPSSHLGPPMIHVGLDLFDFGGKQHLICVDHWSGYPMFSVLSSSTSSAVINILKGWFNLLAWPQSIRSDGGLQFRGEFVKFCVENGILYELSAPHHPRSNGLAESGVKIVKSILIKCLGEGKDIQRALYKWRIAPRQHGFSPAQLMFGRSQNTFFSQPASAFTPVNLREAAAAKDKVFGEQADTYNRDKSELTQLLPGSSLRVQCPKTGSWENIRTVLEMRPDKLSYLIEVQGKIFVRVRYMLRPVKEGGVILNQDQVLGGARSDVEDKESPRRSERLKEKVSVSKFSSCVPQTMMPPAPGVPQAGPAPQMQMKVVLQQEAREVDINKGLSGW